MPNKNYINGRRREYQIMRTLELEGYYCVRSAGSHSKIDITAFLIREKKDENQPLIRAIQSKAGSSPIKEDMKELRKLNLPAIVSKELWVFKNRKLEIIKIPNKINSF